MAYNPNFTWCPFCGNNTAYKGICQNPRCSDASPEFPNFAPAQIAQPPVIAAPPIMLGSAMASSEAPAAPTNFSDREVHDLYRLSFQPAAPSARYTEYLKQIYNFEVLPGENPIAIFQIAYLQDCLFKEAEGVLEPQIKYNLLRIPKNDSILSFGFLISNLHFFINPKGELLYSDYTNWNGNNYSSPPTYSATSSSAKQQLIQNLPKEPIIWGQGLSIGILLLTSTGKIFFIEQIDKKNFVPAKEFTFPPKTKIIKVGSRRIPSWEKPYSFAVTFQTLDDKYFQCALEDATWYKKSGWSKPEQVKYLANSRYFQHFKPVP